MIGGVVTWRRRRKKAREAAHFLRETERMARRGRDDLDPQAKSSIERRQTELRASLASGDPGSVEASMKALDELIERHLAKYRKSQLREYVESIGFAVLVALTLRALVIEAFKIPSGSMIPTLEIGDQIFVNKFLYGMRVPFTYLKLLALTDPKRGEVIVFINPKNPDKDYIKRVIGVPGDKIEVREGQIYVNEQPVPRQPISGPCEYWDRHAQMDAWYQSRCKAYREQLGEHSVVVYQSGDGPHTADFGPEVVMPESVFVMGDNRDNSSDSRAWGQVPFDHIKGRAMFIWWAWSNGSPSFRRFFTSIH